MEKKVLSGATLAIAFSHAITMLLLFGCGSTETPVEFQVTKQYIDTNNVASEEFLDGTPVSNLVFSKLRYLVKPEETLLVFIDDKNTRYLPSIVYFLTENQGEPDFAVEIHDENGKPTKYTVDKDAIYRRFGLSDPALVVNEIGTNLKLGEIVHQSLTQGQKTVVVVGANLLVSTFASKDQIVVSVLTALR